MRAHPDPAPHDHPGTALGHSESVGPAVELRLRALLPLPQGQFEWYRGYQDKGQVNQVDFIAGLGVTLRLLSASWDLGGSKDSQHSAQWPLHAPDLLEEASLGGTSSGRLAHS